MENKEEKPLKKDRDCAECKKLFDCPGKPRNVIRCVCLERR